VKVRVSVSESVSVNVSVSVSVRSVSEWKCVWKCISVELTFIAWLTSAAFCSRREATSTSPF